MQNINLEFNHYVSKQDLYLPDSQKVDDEGYNKIKNNVPCSTDKNELDEELMSKKLSNDIETMEIEHKNNIEIAFTDIFKDLDNKFITFISKENYSDLTENANLDIFKEPLQLIMTKFNINDFGKIMIYGSDEEKNNFLFEILQILFNALLEEINDKTKFKNKFDELREIFVKSIILFVDKMKSHADISNLETDIKLNFEYLLDKLYDKIYNDKFPSLVNQENSTIEFNDIEGDLLEIDKLKFKITL